MDFSQPASTPGPADAAIPAISLILPTYNRLDALRICLAHLERQSMKNFELILVDDGSGDGTADAMIKYVAESRLRMRFLRQPNAGPARARNLAIAHAVAPVCLILGDDIFASPEFVEAHLDFHREHTGLETAAVGLTRWADEGQHITPFMRWLNDGTQFSYDALTAGTPPTWEHFYTSNLSVKTALLKAHPFDERFSRAAMEDIELGYRLHKGPGLRLAFLPNAVASHLHPTSVPQAARRMIGVGAATHLFHELWPEHAPKPGRNLRRVVRDLLLSQRWVLAPLRSVTDWITRFWCPNPLLKPLLELHFAAGYRDAAARSRSSEVKA